MQGIRAMSMLLQVGESEEPLYAKMAVVMRVEDAPKFMAQYQEQLKKYGDNLSPQPTTPCSSRSKSRRPRSAASPA